MKKTIVFILNIFFCVSLLSCATVHPAQNQEIVVFAAASLTEALTEISDVYMSEHPAIKIKFSFESSGTLKTQIQQGAPCDLFISAAQKQMDELGSDAVDLLIPETRVNLLENKVVLAVAEKSRAKISAFSDLGTALTQNEMLLVMGNADVPVGQYTSKILKYLNLDEAALAAQGKITYAANTKEVTSLIASSAADCGVIYQTDAIAAGLKATDYANEAMCGQVIYPAAALRSTQNRDAALAFLTYLRTSSAAEVFKKSGFTAL